MNFVRTALTAATLLAVASPAYAVTITTIFTPGNSDVPAYITNPESLRTFDEVVAPNNTPYVANPLFNNERTTGVVRTRNPSDPSAPQPSAGTFLVVGANRASAGSYSIDFTGQVFSFLIGSLDPFNSVTLNFTGRPAITLTGRQIVTGDTTTPTATTGLTTGRVTYDLGGVGVFTGATFSSTRGAFEFDQLVTAVPEPATWLMMILGFGLVGGQLRRRKVNTKVTFARA